MAGGKPCLAFSPLWQWTSRRDTEHRMGDWTERSPESAQVPPPPPVGDDGSMGIWACDSCGIARCLYCVQWLEQQGTPTPIGQLLGLGEKSCQKFCNDPWWTSVISCCGLMPAIVPTNRTHRGVQATYQTASLTLGRAARSPPIECQFL